MSGSNRLEGKVAVITGAGSGIGQATARRFAEEGASIAALDIDREAAEGTVRELGSESAAAFGVDVSSSDSVAAVSEEVLARFGTVDSVVNVAGVLDGFVPVTETGDDLWERVIGVNLTGTFLISRAFVPALVKTGNGTIINVSSIGSLVAGAGGVAYTASKGGVSALTRQLAVELGPQGVRVNAILPGPIETPMTAGLSDLLGADVIEALTQEVPSRRFGKPEEVAQVALFLASDEASLVYGSSYVADGGWIAR